MKGFAAARLPLAFQPGTDFRYSFSIDVLGYIIQLAAGQAFDEFLRNVFFTPLGMQDTAFWVPPEKVHRLAVIYGPAEGGGLKVVEPFGFDDITQPCRKPFGGGGLVSTIGDYFRFGQLLLNGGELDGVRLLGRKTVEWMLQNHLPRASTDGRAGQRLRPGRGNPAPPGTLSPPWLTGQVRLGWGCQYRVVDRPAEQLNCLLMLQYMPCFTIRSWRTLPSWPTRRWNKARLFFS